MFAKVNVIEFVEVPWEFRVSLIIRKFPSANFRVAPGNIMNVTPVATVMFSEI